MAACGGSATLDAVACRFVVGQPVLVGILAISTLILLFRSTTKRARAPPPPLLRVNLNYQRAPVGPERTRALHHTESWWPFTVPLEVAMRVCRSRVRMYGKDAEFYMTPDAERVVWRWPQLWGEIFGGGGGGE